MVLKLPGLSNRLFDHSEDYNQGLGEVRKGQSTTVVAKDGTGDFDDLQEAIKSLSYGGGKILIKEGRYYAKDLELENNVTIEGESLNVVLELDNSTDKDKYIDMASLSKITFKNLTIELKGDYESWSSSDTLHHIDLSGTSHVLFDNIRFENYADDTTVDDYGEIAYFFTDSSSRIKIINCWMTNKDTGNAFTVFLDSDINDCYFSGNVLTGLNIITGGWNTSGKIENSTITENECEGIDLLNETMNQNRIIGNEFSGFIKTGDNDTSERNVINGNIFTDSSDSIYFGSNANNNVAVGNIVNTSISDSGSNTVANNELY